MLDSVLDRTAGTNRAVVLASHELERTRPLVSREVVLTAGQAHGIAPPRSPQLAGSRQTRPRNMATGASS